MEKDNYKSAYEILKRPFSGLRMRIADKFFSQKLTLNDFNVFSKSLLQEVQSDEKLSGDDLRGEIEKAYRFLKYGEISELPDISGSAKQLIWGLALACSQTDKNIRQNWPVHIRKQPIHELKIWNDIKESAVARTELRRHAFMITGMSFLPNTENFSMRWGSCNYPNVGFYLDVNNNRINLDLLWALLGGFEHSRAMQLHEFGHAYGSLNFGSKMQNLQKEFDELNKKARNKTISKKEYRRLQEIEREYKYRFAVYDEAENSYANRFAVNASNRVRQDIGYDLNSVETLLFQVGQNIEKNKNGLVPVEDTVSNRAYNLQQAIRLSFYVNNAIVEDKPEEWAKLGVNIDWIEYITPDGRKISGIEAFKKLREMTSSLEYMQIKERDYQKSDEEIHRLVLEYAQKRGDIIDEIFDLYAMQYYKDAIHNKENEPQQNQNENSSKQNDNDVSDSEDEPQQNQNENSSEQNDNNVSDSENGGQKSQNTNSGDSSRQNNNNGSDSGNEMQGAQNENFKDDSSSTEEKPSKEGGNGDVEKDAFSSLFDEITEDENMPELNDLVQTPEKAYQEKISSLVEDTDKNEDFKNVMDIVLTPIEDSNKTNLDKKRVFQDAVKVLMSKNLMPENEYSKIVKKHFDMVEQLKFKFEELQNKYYDETDNVETLSVIPETANLKVDFASYAERLKKQIKGEELKEADFRNFVVRDVAKDYVKAPIDIAILIDNSGSMHYAGTDQLAIEIACAIFQATRDNPAFNVYVALMHNPTTWIAKPGENSIEISRRLATIYHSRGSGDDKIGDNIVSILKEIEGRTPLTKKEGCINFFMITDGYHTDGSYGAFQMVDDMASKEVPVTFNWLLTDSIDGNAVQELINSHQTGMGSQQINYEDNVTQDNMLYKILSLIEKRVEYAKQIDAMHVSEKQANLAFLLNNLNCNNGGKNG